MSELCETEDPDSPSGWPLMAAVRPAIETPRLLLRPPAADDAEAIAALANTPSVARALIGMPHPYRAEHARIWLSGAIEVGSQRHLVCLKGYDAAPAPVGVITLDQRGRGGPGWLGCWLGERFWGQGLATEACHAVVDYAFLHQRHDRLLFACRVTNPAGRRVAEKCGFQLVAQELAVTPGSGAAVAIDRFRLDRRTWEVLRAWEPLRIHHRDSDGPDRIQRSRGTLQG